MTINIAVVTSEALVLGCDSIASSTTYLVDPFECARDEGDDGSFKIRVNPDDVVSYVTNTWDGVTKMFPLHAGNCPVAGVTAGLAKLNNRSMSSYASEFYMAHGGAQQASWTAPAFHLSGLGSTVIPLQPVIPQLQTVEEVANEFLRFMRSSYETHYANSKLPEEYRDGPEFLVGGFDSTEHLPCLYQINVQANSVLGIYTAGSFGISWNGQADAVERLLRGYDSQLRARIETEIRGALAASHTESSQAIAAIVQSVLDKLHQGFPEGVSLELPAPPKLNLPWDRFETLISYGNLPVQDAVHLASFLVGLQSGKARFAHGVPTVGGRTHVGVITKTDGLRMLDEPALKLSNPGFS
jgi:hypothetical protein